MWDSTHHKLPKLTTLSGIVTVTFKTIITLIKYLQEWRISYKQLRMNSHAKEFANQEHSTISNLFMMVPQLKTACKDWKTNLDNGLLLLVFYFLFHSSSQCSHSLLLTAYAANTRKNDPIYMKCEVKPCILLKLIWFLHILSFTYKSSTYKPLLLFS